MSKNHCYILLGAMTFFLMSCSLSDFQLDKLTQPTDLNPVIYRPVSNGTYVVKDYAAVPGLGNTPVAVDSLNFNLISYPLDGMTFNTKGTDSMVVVIKTVNETPMKYRYRLSFTGTIMDSGSKSKFLNAATINAQGDVIEASKDSLEFKLNATDVKNLGAVTQIDLSITLYKPDNGTVVANVLKNSQLSFKIGFRAPINLLKNRL